MDYLVGGVMVIAGLILIFSLSKENKIFYLAGGYFVVMGGWWIANAALPEIDLFAGTWGIGFKCFTAVVLAMLIAVFVKEYRKKGRDAAPKDPPEDGGSK